MEESPLQIYVLAAVFAVLPAAAVALRFVARRRTKMQLLWDDWTIVFSLVACLVTAVLLIVGAAAGRLAQHLEMDTAKHEPVLDDRYFVFAKTMYANELTQLLSIGPTKLSVLLLYLRLFGKPSLTFTIINISLIGITLMWTTSFFFANLFKCSPVNAEIIPNPPETSTCIDEVKMFLAQAYSDVVLDVLILSLPIPMIYNMHLPLTKKIGVFCVFLLGALTTAASLTRALYQSHAIKVYDDMLNDDSRVSASQDFTYFLTPMLYWPFIESSLGIVGACLPLYRPLADIHFIKSIIQRIKNAFPSHDFDAVNQDSQHSSTPGSESEGTAGKKPNLDDDGWLRAYHDSVEHENSQPEIELRISPHKERA